MSLPIAPFRTMGTALHMLATKQMSIASDAERPLATTELPWDQVETVTRSLNQYATNVRAVQVRLSGGTGS